MTTRARNAGKRGGGQPKYLLDEALNAAAERPSIMIAIDDAVARTRVEGRTKGATHRNAILRSHRGGVGRGARFAGRQGRGEFRVAQAWLQRLSLADAPPEDHARMLDTDCAGNTEWRAEVMSLLESDGEDAEIIVGAIASEAAVLLGIPTLIGERLGSSCHPGRRGV